MASHETLPQEPQHNDIQTDGTSIEGQQISQEGKISHERDLWYPNWVYDGEVFRGYLSRVKQPDIYRPRSKKTEDK